MVDYRINTFLTLYEVMNYRVAAGLLKLSQPAVTQQIHGLENEYGCRLFYYDGHRLHRTEQAEKLAEYAKVAVFNERRMLKELDPPAVQTIKMGATKTIGEFVIGEDICRFLKRPDRTLEITVDNTQTLLNLLEQGNLDFALVEGLFDKSKYGWRRFSDAPFVGMCHKDHNFAGRTVTFEELSKETVILREQGSGTRAIFESALNDIGKSSRDLGRIICISSFSLIVQMLRQNIGVSFAYSAVAGGAEDIATFHFEGLFETHEFNYVYLKGTDISGMAGDIFGEWKEE